jgi:hypothetical protein
LWFAMQTGLWQDPRVTEASLRRIHTVTRHYGTLRGGAIRVIWVLTIFTGTYGLYLVPDGRSHVSAGLALSSVFGAAALGIVAIFRARRWMDRRFGRVRGDGELRKGAFTVFAPLGYMAGTYLDERYIVPADAPSIVFLGSAGFGAWLIFSLGRYGVHNLLPTIISLVAAVALTAVDDAAAFETWQWNAMRVTALAWLAAGLIDLRLLWNTLGPRDRSEEGVADVA